MPPVTPARRGKARRPPGSIWETSLARPMERAGCAQLVVALPPLLERVHPMTRLLPRTGRLAGCLTFAMFLLGLSGQAALAGWHKHRAPAGCACDNCFGFHPPVWSTATVEFESGPRPVGDAYRVTWQHWPAE